MIRWSLLLVLVIVAPAFAQKDPPKMPENVQKAFKESCAHCHANGKSESGWGDALDVGKMIETGYIKPGKPNESVVVSRFGNDMPPRSADEKVYRPTAADKKELFEWVEKLPVAEVKPPEVKPADARKPVSDADLLAAVQKDLTAFAQADRKFIRYFSLNHLHNNPKVPEEDLRHFRAAVSKLANSLSLKKRIEVPRVVSGTQETLLAIDTRELDWDECKMWDAILAAYPYGLRHDMGVGDAPLTVLAKDVYQAAGDCKLPVIRADWFVVTASRPPLYHTLLFETLIAHKANDPKLKARLQGGSVELKSGKVLGGKERAMTARDLEQYLSVNVEDNIKREKVLRAGFSESGVSEQNRMIERHESRDGAYWKSYDFLPDNGGQANLLRFPLGPVFDGNPNARLAFTHDGGEIIFTLPNGLQGYLLVEGKGQRIDAGPTDVVRDPTKISGSVAIVNGLSCMHCHSKGNKSHESPKLALTWLRDGSKKKFGGEVLTRIERLYPKEDTLRAAFDQDRQRFEKAMGDATRKFYAVGGKEPDGKETGLEPVGVVAAMMNKPITLEIAAAELGLDAPSLKAKIEANDTLQELDLQPLADGKTISRKVWEGPAPKKLGEGDSVFQKTAKVLDRGAPYTSK